MSSGKIYTMFSVYNDTQSYEWNTKSKNKIVINFVDETINK